MQVGLDFTTRFLLGMFTHYWQIRVTLISVQDCFTSFRKMKSMEEKTDNKDLFAYINKFLFVIIRAFT